jgi:hypothetical protein
MAIMLTILFRGLVALGLRNRTARRIMLRCALDSTPLARRHVLTALAGGDTLNTSDVARAAGIDPKVARFALEELELLGLVRGRRRVSAEQHDEDDEEDPRIRRRRRDWTLSGDEGSLAARLLDEVGRSVEYPPPSPPIKTREPYGSSDPAALSESGSGGPDGRVEKTAREPARGFTAEAWARVDERARAEGGRR